MNIAVCDDNQSDSGKLKAYIESALAERRIACAVFIFGSGEAMLAGMGNNSFPICFLDIYMKGISGVELAHKLREAGEATAIVFTTTSKEHMADGFSVGAVHYLVKPFTQEAVGVALDRSLRYIGENERYVELNTGRQSRRIILGGIRYVESLNQYSVLYLENEELRMRMSLDEMQAALDDPRFLRCHRSFIVNLDHAVRMEKDDFVLQDGTLVSIRRENRAELRRLFEDYVFDKTRRRL